MYFKHSVVIVINLVLFVFVASFCSIFSQIVVSMFLANLYNAHKGKKMVFDNATKVLQALQNILHASTITLFQTVVKQETLTSVTLSRNIVHA